MNGFIFYLQFWRVLDIADKTNDIVGILRELWDREIYILCKIWISKFDLISPELDFHQKASWVTS